MSYNEITLPEVEAGDSVFIPVAKYEMLINDSRDLEAVKRYLNTPKASLQGVKVMLEVE